MWDEIQKYLPEFPSAVLNGRDAGGYPYSVRCRPSPDRTAGLLRLDDPAPKTAIRPGPASLLCHRHDEELGDMKMFLVRGRLERGEDGWAFAPGRFVPGVGIGGAPGMVRFLVGARRSTAAYLKKRGLDRPRIPWGEIEALQEQARRSRQGSIVG